MGSPLLTLPEPRSLPEFIRARRRVLNLSQVAAAKKMKISQSKLSLIESGKQELSLGLLGVVAKALKVDVQTLIDFVVK